MAAPPPGPRWLAAFFAYETTKSVVVKSWVVGAVNRAVQLLILSYFLGWVFLHEKAYQVRDTVIESSVVTKVKGVGKYAGRVLDTADYVTPPQGTSVFVVITKRIVTENQEQGLCPERRQVPLHRRQRLPEGQPRRHGERGADGALRALQRDTAELRDPGLVPAGGGHRGGTRHAGGRKLHPLGQEQRPLPALRLREGQPATGRPGGRAEPLPLPSGPAAPLPRPAPGRCGPLGRPGLRHVGHHGRRAGHQDRLGVRPGPAMGALLAPLLLQPPGRRRHHRHRLQLQVVGFGQGGDAAPTPPVTAASPGYRSARYYRRPDGTERRCLTKAFGIRFDVLVYGSAGKFSIVPTLVNVVAACTSVGVGSVLCDLILLHFLKGAEHYKARKFEEVPEASPPRRSAGPTAPGGGEMGSTDAATVSL